MLTLYVLVNNSLKMSKGKVASQVAHAIAKLAANDKTHALEQMGEDEPSRVVVLAAKDGEQMRNMKEYLEEQKWAIGCYVDEGDYETDPFSMTAMAIQPFNRASYGREEDLYEILDKFPLYGKKKKLFHF